ncbi:MAG: HEAT repeat domain-containing protein [Planctomycetota bacterium]
MFTDNDLTSERTTARASGAARSRRGLDVRGLAVVLAVLLLSPAALAHGGQYNGPGGPGGPGNPPSPRPGGTPRTGGVTASEEPTWRNWWDRNREEFFDVRERRLEKAREQDPNYGGGAIHRSATSEDVEKLILPVLAAALKDGSADVRRRRDHRDGPRGPCPEARRARRPLRRQPGQGPRAAMLAVGLLRDPRGEAALIEVMTADDTGYRERGIAAIALGFSGGDRAKKALSERLGHKSALPRVSRVKARELEGCRALGLPSPRTRPGLDPRRGPREESLDARRQQLPPHGPHRACALRGRGRGQAGPRRPLGARQRRAPFGRDPRRPRPRRRLRGDDVKAFIRAYDGERDARQTSRSSRSRRLGHPLAVKRLRSVLTKGRSARARLRRPGARHRPRPRVERVDAQDAGRREGPEPPRRAHRSPSGILDDRESAPLVLKTLKDVGSPELRADLVTCLAMMDHRDALPTIREITGEAKNGRLVRDCGLALVLLEDESSLDQLLSILENSGSIDIKGGMASALGRAGDRRTIARLVELATAKKETDLTRAFAIVALGLIGDKSGRSAFARVAIDSNYPMRNAEALKQVIDIF